MMKSLFFKSVFSLMLVFVVFGFGQLGSAQAQATFQVSSTTSVLTKTGHTELLGSVTFTVSSGTTVNGRLEVFIPNITFTNNVASGITLTGTGGLATSTIANVVGDSGIIIINVPPGATLGASVTLSGIRMSAAGKTFDTLDASISSTGNSIQAGQNSVRLVRSTAVGLIIDTASQVVVSVANGVVVTSPGAIIVTEGWERAFSSAIGIGGQTKKTEIIFQVTGLPDNVSLTFPSLVPSNTGATLVTPTASPEVVTNQSLIPRVVYQFTEGELSSGLQDSFSLTPAINFTGAPGTGTAVIQVGLGPIGAAVPTVELPSTDIPRFAELFLPPLSSIPGSQPVTTKYRLSVPASLTSHALTISNTTSGGAVLTVRARREDGTLSTGANFTNETTRSIPARQTATFSLTDLFGAGAAVSGISSIEVESQNSGLVVNGIGTIGNRRVANSQLLETPLTLLPFDRKTNSDNPQVVLHNTGASEVPATVTLRSSAGATLATAQRIVGSLGVLRENFSSLFPSISIPLEGYVSVRTPTVVRTSLLNNSANRPDEVPALSVAINTPIFSPFFAFGGGYSSVLELINPLDRQVRVLLSAFTANGNSISAQPFAQVLASNERQNFDFASIFATGSAGITAGYFSVALENVTPTNPFANPPQVYGILRLDTPAHSTVVPFSVDAGNQFYLTPGAETSTTYTGLAVLNPGTQPTNVTVEATSSAGSLIGSISFILNGRTVRIQLLRELIPASFNNDNVLIRITSTPGTVKLTSFRGALNLDELIYLKGETTP